VTILLGGVWMLLGMRLGVQGWSFSYLRGRKRVDENILCVAWLYGCVGVLGGMYLCWVVVEYLLVCGVVSLVFRSIMAECSTSDMGPWYVWFPGVLSTMLRLRYVFVSMHCHLTVTVL
jgi:hypothetical protein